MHSRTDSIKAQPRVFILEPINATYALILEVLEKSDLLVWTSLLIQAFVRRIFLHILLSMCYDVLTILVCYFIDLCFCIVIIVCNADAYRTPHTITVLKVDCG